MSDNLADVDLMGGSDPVGPQPSHPDLRERIDDLEDAAERAEYDRLDVARMDSESLWSAPISNVERLTLREGDVLVVHLNTDDFTQEQADEIREKIRALLGRPTLDILMLGKNISVKVIEGTG